MEKKETNRSTVPGKIKILFLAANPAFTEPLKIDEEIRAIEGKIRAAEYRDSIELKSAWAVRPDDLQQKLLEYKPHIVHFSGHGAPTGELFLLDKDRNPKPVKPEALQSLFTILKDNIRIVFFNACYTEKQARAINEVIDCVIGMNTYISDQASTFFAASFYSALGFGRSIKDAFELGKTALQLEGIPGEDTPKFLTKEGIDASKILIEPIMEEEETKKLLEAGLELFKLKDYSAASDNFQKARKLTPTNKKAQFFYCLSFLSGKLIGSIQKSEMDEINNILNNILQEKDKEFDSLARIVLGIIRYDYYQGKNFCYQGLPSGEIFKQLVDYKPTDEEKQLIRHMIFSDFAKIKFNLY